MSNSFFAELKRRKVVRVAIAYLGAVSIMLEISDNVFEVLVLDGLQRVMVVAAAAGLPVVLVLAWLFDLTSKGVERTPELAVESDAGSNGFSARFTRQLVVSGALVILAMTGVGWRYMPNDRVDFEGNRVVVAPFTNDTGDADLDHVGTIIAREISRNLERLEGLVIDPGNGFLFSSRPPASQGEEERRSAQPAVSPTHALAEQTRAGLVVSGSFYRGGDDLVLTAEVYDAERGERVFTGEPILADPEDLMAGIEQLKEGLFGFMAGMGDVVAVLETTMLLQTRPPSYAAYKQFVQGVELIGVVLGSQARQLAHLDSAVSLDSSFVAAMRISALLRVTFGDPEGAKPNLDRLESMRADLTPYERAGLDRVQAMAARDWQGAYRASKLVVDLVGTSMSHYLAGDAALRVNRPKEARDHYLKFDRERIRTVVIWQQLARANHRLGSHRAELRLMRQMLERYPRMVGLPFLRVGQMGALAAVGRGEEALEALSSFELVDAGAGFFISVAEELEAHGDPERARLVRERLLAREEAIPMEERDRGYLPTWPRILASLGRFEEAREVFQSLIEGDPEAADPRIDAALAAARNGDRAYAEQTITWLGDRLAPSQRGSVDQARIAASLGDAERAVRLLRQAEAWGEIDFDSLHLRPAYQIIRDHPAFKEYMKPRG